MNDKRLLILICILAIVLSAALSGLCFRFLPFEPDGISYLFQAKLFAQGRLFAPSPPDHGFSPSKYINIHNGKWYSRFPFGNALMLTPGVLVGAPWLIPAILTGLALFLLYLIVKEAYGKRIAMLTAVLGLISPATLGMGATWFSQNVSRFFLAIYLLSLIKTLKGGRWFYAALSGFALGYVLNTRPLSAVIFGIAGAGFALHWVMRHKKAKTFLKKILIFFIPLAMMVGMYLVYNACFTGNPFKFIYNACHPYDKLGFGRRVCGIHTPKDAFARTLRHVLPSVSFSTFGWGYYHPSLFLVYDQWHSGVSTGIIVNSLNDGKKILLRLYGFKNGEGKIQIWSTDGEFQSKRLYLLKSDGLAEVSLRLVKKADQYSGYFKAVQNRRWVRFEPLSVKLQAPLEVGIYVDTGNSATNFRADYDFFYVNSDSSAELVSSDFTEPPVKLMESWHWSAEPKRWKLTQAGWLTIWGKLKNMFCPDERLSKFYQITNSDTFDIETHFLADWRKNNFLFLLRVIPLAFPFILMFVPFFHSSRNRYDILFLSFFLLSLLCYFFYWGDTHSCWGNSPVNSSYYNESMLLGIIPLIARGMHILYGRMKRLRFRFMFTILLILLSVNTAYSYALMVDAYRNWNSIYQDIPKLVAEQDIHRAVIFVTPYRREAPLGDYPFKSLKDADIIYFNSPRITGLGDTDLYRVYKQYFQGRRPYLYRNGKLIPISEADMVSKNSEIIR